MSYYIEPYESFSAGIARIGAEQNEKAIEALDNPEQLHKGIHKARKHFKKLRALFRLVRDETGQGYYKSSNVFYRDRGRELAPLRDITSLVKSLDMLEEAFSSQVKKKAFDDLRELLEEERQSIRQKLIDDGSRLQQVTKQLKDARSWFMTMPVEDGHLEDTVHSLRRVYKRGYKRFQKAQKDPTPYQMHQWRKRTKYLWYHHRLLKKTWPRVYKAYAKSIHDLSDLLGDHHDFTLLAQKIERLGPQLSDNTCWVLRALCQERQAVLAKDAFDLGPLIYAEHADAFARRQQEWLKMGPYR